MNKEDTPLVSVGLMVFNAEKFLRKSIESLLAQDYENFEIIICDNASEDSSGEICKEYAEKDGRIKYYRNEKNIAALNGIKVFDLSSGEYFMWAADHDMWHPTFISKLAKVLYDDPSVLLCYSQTLFIDTSDAPTAIAPDTIDTRGLKRTDRFKKIIWELDWCNMFYGLYRSEKLKKVTLGRNVIGADNIILAEISLLGAIAQVKEPLYYRRNNRPGDTPQIIYERRMKLFSETEGYNMYDILIPNTLMAFEHIKVIENADLMIDDKVLLINEIIQCFSKRYENQINGEIAVLAKFGLELLNEQADDQMATCMHAMNLMRLINIIQLFYNHERLNILRAECFQSLGLHKEMESSLFEKVGSLKEESEVEDLLLTLTGQKKAITNSREIEKGEQASNQLINKSLPLVSIGLCVFNAEKFLRKSIDSLLAQDYENFELIICDNASEDLSEDICREYAAKDKRIKYYRNKENIGGKNGQKAFKLSSGKYFMWAADHDLWSPQFISKCLQVLEKDPNILLCYGKTTLIDEDGSVKKLIPNIIDTRDLTTVESFKKMVWNLEDGIMMYGLFRAASIRKLMPWPNTMGPDLVILCRLSLYGPIAQLNEPLFFSRENRPNESPAEAEIRWKENIKIYGSPLECNAPWLMMANAHMESVIQSNLSEKEKSILFNEVIHSCVSRFGESIQSEIKQITANAMRSLVEEQKESQEKAIGENDLPKLSDLAKTFFPNIEETYLLSTATFLKSGELEKALNISKESINKFPNSAAIQALSNYITHHLQLEVMTWEKLLQQQTIKLYAGDTPNNEAYKEWTGLSITRNDATHIAHDITLPLPLPDNSVDAFQSEDVFEHIQPDKLVAIINEIFRVLKPQSLFRLSIPDYGCDVLFKRSIIDDAGAITFDPDGGGTVEKPGHVWFPRINSVKEILKKTAFQQAGTVDYLHFYNMDGQAITNKIDYSKGHVQRTPDFDKRVQNPFRPMSLVVDLTKSAMVSNALHITEKHKPLSLMTNNKDEFPKFSFITIVLNGMPFLEYAVKAIYDFAHEIVIVEGAVENCMFAANSDGSSKDGTVEFIRNFPDPQKKIKLIQGLWPEKVDMQNRALEHISGDYIWLVDSDEIYRDEDLLKVRELIKNNRSITQINFIPDNFWKGFDYIFVSPLFFIEDAHYRRVFKFDKEAKFSSHRPPTLYLPGSEVSTEEMNLIDGNTTREMGIIPFHYSYINNNQVLQKIDLYKRYGWGKSWGIDLKDWYDNFFLKWTQSNRDALESKYPVWTGDKNSRTEKFGGMHPKVMKGYIKRFKESLPPESEKTSLQHVNKIIKNSNVKIAEDYVKSGMKVDEESSFALSIQKLFKEIRPEKIIETGTYLGTGTTLAIASTLKDLSLDETLFYSIEVNPVHYQHARRNLTNSGMLNRVNLLNGLSVPRAFLPTIKEIETQCVSDIEFNDIFVDHQEYDRALLYYGETDFENVKDNLLGKCLEEFNYCPDFVILDSGGHMGNVEFNYLISQLKGECHIALDDIYHIKHHKSFLQIQSDPRFAMLTSSKEKFGFCIAKFTPSQKLKDDEVKKILWIRPDAIGDNILASSMLPHIQNKYKNAAITVVCQERVSSLYKACDLVDNIITFDRKLATEEGHYIPGIIKQLKSIKADIAFNSAYSREPLVDRLTLESGARERIAIKGDLSNISPRIFNRNNMYYSRLMESEEIRKPELERHKDFLKELDINVKPLQPIMWISDDDEKYADNFFSSNGLIKEKTIALFGGAQYDLRIYDHYGRALSKLCKDKEHTIIALGSSGEQHINQQNIDDTGIIGFNLCGETTLGQTAAILKRCKVAIGAESGLAHIACAVETPNVIVMGGGHFGRFMPYSPLTSTVCLPLECYGCNWQCKYDKIHCIKDVASEVLVEAITQTIESPSEKPRLFIQGSSLWHPDSTQPKWLFFDKLLNISNVEIIMKGNHSISLENVRNVVNLTKKGEEYYSNGETDKAEECFIEALLIDNKYAKAHNNLGVLYYNEDKKEMALDHYNEAAGLEPLNITFQKNKADFYAVELGNYDVAMQIYVKILSSSPSDIESLTNIGHICIALNKYDDAKDFFKKVLDDDPGNQAVRQHLESLKNRLQTQSTSIAQHEIQPDQIDSSNQRESESKYYNYARPEIQALIPEDAKTVLDIGCGSGALGEAIKKRQGSKVWGIEIVDEAGQLAKKKLDNVIIGNVEDALASIPDNHFDTIICADVLEHLPNPEEILIKAKVKLNSGGNIIASIPNVRHWSVVKNLIEGRWDYEDAGILDRTHLRFFTKKNIIELFNKCGYSLELMQATSIDGINISDDVVSALTSANIDTSTLKAESNHYQYLIRGKVKNENKALSSLIVLTCNNLDYTKRCIESILLHTKEPYELIVVDNASSDGTVNYLENEICKKNKNVKIIKNNTNAGYAAGNNLGIEAARGDYVLLLNNDIVVTAGWLDKLINCAEQQDDIGIVGPMSNCVNGPQLVSDISYKRESLDGLESFAGDFSKKHNGESTPFPRVIGFCMLIKKAVIEKIGGLDEKYGLGNLEDDDFCLRSAFAGFKTLIAKDCFIHHFGGKTFADAGIDYDASMKKNWEIFKSKWEMPKYLPFGQYKFSDINKEIVKSKLYVSLHSKDITGSAALNNAGEALFEKGDLDGALNKFKEAVTLDSNNAAAVNNMGITYYQLGEKTEAFNQYEKAIILAPDNITFRKNIADFLYFEKGDIAKSIKIYTFILDQDNEDIEALLALGQISLSSGLKQDALDFYSRVIEIDRANDHAKQKILEILTNGKEKSERVYYEDEYLISAIISTYNSERFIRGCLDDLLDQSIAKNIEIIVINSGSEQNEEEIVKEYQLKHSNIKYIKTDKRETVYAAWNHGVEAAKGKYITNANSDDRHSSDAFEIMTTVLEANPEIALVYADLLVTEKENESFHDCTPLDYYRWANWSRKALLEEGCFMGPQPMWRKTTHQEYGLFDPSYVTSGDFEFWLRISQSNDFLHIPLFLGLYLKAPGSIEHSNSEKKGVENSKIFQMYRDANASSEILHRHEEEETFNEELSSKSEIRADQLYQKGNIDDAVKTLLHAIGDSPDEKELYFSLAKILIDAKEFNHALNVLNELSTTDDDVRKLELQGYCEEGLQHFDVAAKYVNKVLSINANSANALNLKGVLAYREEKIEEAQELFTKAISADSNLGEAFNNLGIIKIEKKQPRQALDLIEKAFILSPKSTDIATTYHTAISDTKEFLRAENLFRKAKELHPYSKMISFFYIDTLINLEKYDESIKEIESAIVTFGVDDGILDAGLAIREKIAVKTKIDIKLSVSMIVKNEEKDLVKCLNSLTDIADEIVIVDTGSHDRTKKIARLFGAKIFDFKWVNDFSKARNFSISKVTGQWILSIDADEILSPLDYKQLLDLINKSSTDKAYSIVTRNYTSQTNAVGWTANDGKYINEETGSGWVSSVKVRLFPKKKGVKFEYPVHEMVEPSLKKSGMTIVSCQIPIHHYGKLNEEKVGNKGEDYFEIGIKKLEANGDSKSALKELAIQAAELDKYDMALDLWHRYIELDSKLPAAFVNMSTAYMKLGQYDKGLDSAKKALDLLPTFNEAGLNYGTCALYLGDAQLAIKTLEEVIERSPEYLAGRFKLAAAYSCNGQKEKGLASFERLEKSSKIGKKELAIPCQSFAKNLIVASQLKYAIALLETAIEGKYINKDVLSLLSKCMKEDGPV